MRSARGFTLVEALVSAAIMSIILTGVGAAVIGTQSAIQGQFESRSATEGTSVAMTYLGRTMRFASYGIDPVFAFDFTNAARPSVNGSIPTDGTFSKNNDNTHQTSDGTVVAGAVQVGFDTDDLAFRYRDPSYVRSGTLAGASISLVSGQTVGQVLPANQLIMIQCRTDPNNFVYGRLTSATSTTGSGLTLTNAGAPFPAIPGALPGCFSDTSAPENTPAVMIVHEVRIRVVPLNGVPHLVAFHNFLTIDPTTALAVFDPIVGNVESFQVAYLMNTLPAGQICCDNTAVSLTCCARSPVTCCTVPADVVKNDGVLGDGLGWDVANGVATAPPALTDIPTAPASAALIPTMERESFAPQRYNTHPANIRGVRVTLTLRSPRPLPTAPKVTHPLATVVDTFAASAAVENFTYALPSSTAAATKLFYQYFRVRTTQAFRLPNMSNRFNFAPPEGGGT